MNDHRDIFDRVRQIYNRGQYLDAFEAGKPLGPLTEWPTTRGRVLAGRMGLQLGAPRLSRVLFRQAWRADPTNPEACYFHVAESFSRLGPYRTWGLMRQIGEEIDAEPTARADWYGLWAYLFTAVRDFTQAEHFLNRAEALAPELPYVWIVRSSVMEAEDRFDEALEAARHAKQLVDWYRPAVEAEAHLLLQIGRDEEARELLLESLDHLQCGRIVWQLVTLELELDRPEEARLHAELIEPLVPLLEKHGLEAISAIRAEVAYHTGDYPNAARHAQQVDAPLFKAMARLGEEDESGKKRFDGRRVELPVQFVRQHHNTCSPATLTAICQFFEHPVEHLEIAEAICHGGTAPARERAWATEQGFAVREFRVTWESAVALIDRGIPFALHIGGTGWAHAQAVIGYDSRLGTLLIRDPSARRWFEYVAEEFFKDHRAAGPRGMVVLPAEEASRLDGVELPEIASYDRLFALMTALEHHHRDAAQEVLDTMRDVEPTGRLTIEARARLAHYDGDTTTVLRCSEQTLAAYPEDGNALLMKWNALRELGRREDRLELLREACHREKTDPLYWQRYAAELSIDARDQDEALYWLRRSVRARREEGWTYKLIADILWDRSLREESLQMYRFTACLEETDQQAAHVYFVASRHLNREDEAIVLLKDRFDRFGGRSSLPARTLCFAYGELERSEEAAAVLLRAMERLPDDGELLLYAARVRARFGEYDEAKHLLEEARDRTHRLGWLRGLAELAHLQADLPAALGYLREVVESDPLALDAHERIASLLSDLEGPEAAQTHLREAVARFPHHCGLRMTLIEWLGGGDPVPWAEAVDELLEIHPTDPWGRRERAVTRLILGQTEEALADAELALDLDPQQPAGHVILGHAQRDLGRLDEARQSYRRAIRLSVDHQQAISALLELCDSKQQRVDELQFVREQLASQVTFGDALFTYGEHASGTLEPEVMLADFREASRQRPDLWQTHVALTRQLLCMEQPAEAREVAEGAIARFPLVSSVWVELASLCREEEDVERELDALRKAHQISPNWSEGVCALAEALQRRGEFAEAKTLLLRAVVQQPGNPVNLGTLAEVLSELDEKEHAVERLMQAVRLNPGYDWGWDKLNEYCEALHRPERPVELARQLSESRPYDARAWYWLGRLLGVPKPPEEGEEADGGEGVDGVDGDEGVNGGERVDDHALRSSGTCHHEDEMVESIAAIRHAIELSPRMWEAYDVLALRLADQGEMDEALAACEPEALGEAVPWMLRARAADIEDRRGNRPGAIDRMKIVVAENPDAFTAWMRLTDWHQEAGELEPTCRAAENMVRIAPHHAISWGYLGDAQRASDQATEARESFGKACDLDPNYWFAALNLIELCLDASLPEQAVEVFDRTGEHIPPPFRHEFHVRVESHKHDSDGEVVDEHLRLLCRSLDGKTESLIRAVDAAKSVRKFERIDAILDEEMRRAGTSAEVSGVWAHWNLRGRGRGTFPTRLDALRALPDLWAPAAEQYVIHLHGDMAVEQLRNFVKTHHDSLQEATRTFNAVGWAYAQLGQTRDTLRWFADWRNRSDITADSLDDLVPALWETRRIDEALDASRHALSLPPSEATWRHHWWLALHEATEGEPDEAERLLEACPLPPSRLPYYQAIVALILALISVRRDQPTSSFWKRRRHVRRKISPHAALFKQDKILARAYRRGMQRLASEMGKRLTAACYRLTKW